MKSSANKSGVSGTQRKHLQARAVDQKDFRKVKSYLEDESLFKDIERSTEYQDPLNLHVADPSAINTDTAPVDTEDIQME